MKEEEENNDAPGPVEDLAKVPEEYVAPGGRRRQSQGVRSDPRRPGGGDSQAGEAVEVAGNGFP